MNQRKSCIPNRNHIIGNTKLKVATKFSSAASLYQPEEDKYFPYSKSHLNALFDDYNLTIAQQQYELFQITQNIQRINKLIKQNQNESEQLNKLLNKFNDSDNLSDYLSEDTSENYSENCNSEDIEAKITNTLRQNFQDSQQLSIETEKVSDLTDKIELYQNFNEKCNHYINSDISKETDDIIELLSRMVEENDNQMNEKVKSYEFKIKQKDAIIAELQERIMKIKNPDFDPNKDPNFQFGQNSPVKKDLSAFPSQKKDIYPMNNEHFPMMKKPDPFHQMQNTEAFPPMIKKNNSFPASYNAEPFPSLRK